VVMSEAMQLKELSIRHIVEADLPDVPAGYKRTEAGVMPEDWSVSSVGTEFKVQLGKMLDSARNVGIPKPYIGNRSVQWGWFDLEDLGQVPMTLSDLQRFRLRQNDLLVCEGGEIGRAAVWNEAIPECYYQKALHRLRPKRGYDVVLMMFFLHLWASTGYLLNYVTQTSIAHLPKDKLEVVPLPVPSPLEQRAITKGLSDVDELLAALEALIAKKRAIKQAATQQLLTGKIRLPGFSGKWEIKPIRDIAPLQRGFDLPTAQLRSGPYPVVYSNGVLQHHQQMMVKGPGVVTGRSGTIGKVHFVERDYWPHNTTLWVTSFRGNVPKFIFFLFKHINFARFLSGSGVPTLNRNDVHAHLVACPQPSEQTAIAAVLSDMDADIAALEARRGKTRAIKQGMMQQLLTGRIRLV
jgi:type I restriction enzyme, S subunit